MAICKYLVSSLTAAEPSRRWRTCTVYAAKRNLGVVLDLQWLYFWEVHNLFVSWRRPSGLQQPYVGQSAVQDWQSCKADLLYFQRWGYLHWAHETATCPSSRQYWSVWCKTSIIKHDLTGVTRWGNHPSLPKGQCLEQRMSHVRITVAHQYCCNTVQWVKCQRPWSSQKKTSFEGTESENRAQSQSTSFFIARLVRFSFAVDIVCDSNVSAQGFVPSTQSMQRKLLGTIKQGTSKAVG